MTQRMNPRCSKQHCLEEFNGDDSEREREICTVAKRKPMVLALLRPPAVKLGEAG